MVQKTYCCGYVGKGNMMRETPKSESNMAMHQLSKCGTLPYAISANSILPYAISANSTNNRSSCSVVSLKTTQGYSVAATKAGTEKPAAELILLRYNRSCCFTQGEAFICVFSLFWSYNNGVKGTVTSTKGEASS